MRRREFIWVVGGCVITGTIGCKPDPVIAGVDAMSLAAIDAPPYDAISAIDACVQSTVKMHDTYAQALYFDGSNGPLTGVITVAHTIAGAALTMDFWHGHGGVPHRFTLQPGHFDALKRGERITVGTTTVDNHSHTLFVDPTDEVYRVSGAPDIDVPLGCS